MDTEQRKKRNYTHPLGGLPEVDNKDSNGEGDDFINNPDHPLKQKHANAPTMTSNDTDQSSTADKAASEVRSDTFEESAAGEEDPGGSVDLIYKRKPGGN